MQTASLDLLEKTQLPPDQARAILAAMEVEMTAREERLSSRNEMTEAFHSLELAIASLRGDLDAKIAGSEGRLVRWLFTCMLGQSAVIAGAVYFAITHLRS
jgi:hypothetical protein